MSTRRSTLSKQANPLRGPAAKSVQMALQKMLGGLKTYGKRLTGDSTLTPLWSRDGLLKDMKQTLMQSRRPIADEVGPLSVLRRANNLVDKSQTVLQRDLLTAKAQSAYSRWRDAIKNNKSQRLAFGGSSPSAAEILAPYPPSPQKHISGGGIYGDISKLMGQNNKAIEKELDAIRKTRLYTGGAGLAGTTLTGLGAAYNNLTREKQSAPLPPPSSRGETKKVAVPESDDKEPDLDPEGVQMTEQDHNAHKKANFGAMLKMLATGEYKTPQKQASIADFNASMSKLTHAPNSVNIPFGHLGLGGAAAGAISGALSAPKGRLLRRTLMGAGLGGLTGLGAGVGASAGANLVLGNKPRIFPLSQDEKSRATLGMGLGLGLGAGSIQSLGGGLINNSGNADSQKFTPEDRRIFAELSRGLDAGPPKKKKKDDDKDVKEAAAALLARLQQSAGK
jgi:hypothetical protein